MRGFVWEDSTMVTKLTITIPDDLAKRLEPHRDHMNISRYEQDRIIDRARGARVTTTFGLIER